MEVLLHHIASFRGACTVLLAVWVAPAAAAPASAQAAESRPNILWIIGEDMGPELGCYGTPQVWTPRLDALGRRGNALHTGVRHGAGLFGQPQRVYDRDVSNDDRRPQPSFAPGRRLPLAGRRATADALGARRGLLHRQHSPRDRRSARYGQNRLEFSTGRAAVRRRRLLRSKGQSTILRPGQLFRGPSRRHMAGGATQERRTRRSGESRHSAVLPRSSYHARRLGQLP